MLLRDLKIPKQLVTTLQKEGLETATEVQEKGLNRIIGGQDVILVSPEGSGKSTLIAISVITKLKNAFEDAPRALVLVPTIHAVEHMVSEFDRLLDRNDLRVEGVHAKGNIATQKDDLFEGVDVVVGTPDRVYSLLLKYGLNLNQLKMFVLDDAEQVVKQGFHVQIRGLADGLPKCQTLVSTSVYHSKLQRLMSDYLNYPTLLEVFPTTVKEVEYIVPALYEVPNFKTKQNLLVSLLKDQAKWSKVVIFANTRLTVGNLYDRVKKQFEHGEVAILHALLSTQYNVDSLDEFVESSECRVLFVAHETHPDIALGSVEQLIVFDQPELAFESQVKRLIKPDFKREAYFFATDLELAQISKIASEIGEKMSLNKLPTDLIIEGKRVKKLVDEGDDPTQGGAFHEKKDKNVKDQPNYNTYDKRKMFGKARKKGKK